MPDTPVGDDFKRMTVLRRQQVEMRTGLSRSSIYARMNPNKPEYDPTFPKPIHLSNRRVVWVEHEIEAWLSAKAAKRRARKHERHQQGHPRR